MFVQYIAQRLLNPYRGVMHTIRYASAEAVTLDGAHWDIYVSNDALLEGLTVNRWTQITDIRYGSWSLTQGLKRGPLYPSDDFRRMEEMGAMVYEHLTRMHQQVPFALQDSIELWLLDSAQQPLALLSSVLTESAIDLDEPIVWRAGYSAAEHFTSPACAQLGYSHEAPAEYLTRYINGRAGAQPVAQWFHRQADGGGLGLRSIGTEALQGRSLPMDAFPPHSSPAPAMMPRTPSWWRIFMHGKRLGCYRLPSWNPPRGNRSNSKRDNKPWRWKNTTACIRKSSTQAASKPPWWKPCCVVAKA